MTARDKPPVGRRPVEPYVKLPHWMLRSAAWMTLSPDGKAVLIDIWRRHNGQNNGAIGYAVRDAEEIGLSKDKTARAIAQLVERGFLVIRKGSSFDLKTKQARTWQLTCEPCNGKPATKDFMRWSPTEKSRTRSQQRDAQSRPCDTRSTNETKLPTSVAPVRPSPRDSAVSQSHQRDTSNIPGDGGFERDAAGLAPTPATKSKRHFFSGFRRNEDEEQDAVVAGKLQVNTFLANLNDAARGEAIALVYAQSRDDLLQLVGTGKMAVLEFLGACVSQSAEPPATASSPGIADVSGAETVPAILKKPRHGKRGVQVEPNQLDLEDDGIGYRQQLNPVADARHRLSCLLKDAPRGTHAQIARRLGINSCSLTNFLVKGDGLNKPALSVLRQLLDAMAS